MQSVNLNLIPGSVLPVINLTQFDEGRQFALVIYDGSTAADLSGATLQISGKKNDETAFSYDQTDTVKGNLVITVSGNTVTIRNTLQMGAASGDVLATLTVKKSAADVSTLNFVIRVQEHPLDGVDISETEIPAIIALAQEQVDQAEAWATGEIGGVPVPSDAPQYENSAEWWAQQAQIAAQGGLKWKGSCTFAQIPTIGMADGDMWNISDSFTTDARFREGAGIQVNAGTNIAWDGTYWDLLATGSPAALPAGGIAGQTIVKQSSNPGDASWGAGTYYFDTVAEAQAAIAGGTVPNGATVMVTEIGGGLTVTPSMGDLSDVQLMSLANGNVLIYNSTAQKWENKPIDSALSMTSSNPVKNSVVASALARGRVTFAANVSNQFGYIIDGSDTLNLFFPGPTITGASYAANAVFSFASNFFHQDNKFVKYGRLMVLEIDVMTSLSQISAGRTLVCAMNNGGALPVWTTGAPAFGMFSASSGRVIGNALIMSYSATIADIYIDGPADFSNGSDITIKLIYFTND
jgi:hypothetical protein